MIFLSGVAAPATSAMLGTLFWVAIVCVVIWAIIALVKWSQIPIPQPVWIIFIALVSIFLIILLFRAFGMIT